MKGWPYTECLLVLAMAALLAFPLFHLTSAESVKHIDYSEEIDEQAAGGEHRHVESLEAYVDIRTSHAPLSLFVYHQDKLIFETRKNAGAKEFDAEFTCTVEHGYAEILVTVNWPEGIRGYIECSIEPDKHTSRKAGAWGDQQQVSVLEFQWPHHH